MQYQDRHVVVTGGTGALGAAVVAALREAGAICHVPYRAGAPEPAAGGPASGPPLHAVAAGDLADPQAVAEFYQRLPPLWASIHLAGGFAAGPLRDADPASLQRQINDNLLSCLLCCRAAVAAMGPDGGRIVNVAARPALEPRQGAGMVAYTAAKAAVAALTIALAEEVARDGILVNAVAPSIIDTPANRAAMPKADHATWPKPAEIAASILFLAAPQNVVTRGAIVPVYGRT